MVACFRSPVVVALIASLAPLPSVTWSRALRVANENRTTVLSTRVGGGPPRGAATLGGGVAPNATPATVAAPPGGAAHLGGGAAPNATAAMVAAPATTGDTSPRTAAGKRLRPLLWLHVPKTGSSFATTVAHFGCPSVPADVTVMEPQAFSQRYSFTIWCIGSFRRFNSGHDPIPTGVAYEHVVGMFRAPRARLASGYFHRLHDCPALRRKECTTWGPLEPESNCDALVKKPLLEQRSQISAYSKCVEGCTAHMLAGKECGVMGDHFNTAEEPEMLTDVYRLTSPRVAPFDSDSLLKHSEERALNAIQHLGFVGLTEQWPLSVCLFHAVFGGKCYKASFANLRPGHHTDKYAGFYKIADWSMGIDETIYDATSKRFWNDVKANGVSVARCRQEICPDASEYFQEGVYFEIEDDDEF